MHPKVFLVCDPARVITDRAAWQAFRDIFDACMESGTEWTTGFGKVTVSYAYACPKGKLSFRPGSSISSRSGIMAMFYLPGGWTYSQASSLGGFAAASRSYAASALSKMAFGR